MSGVWFLKAKAIKNLSTRSGRLGFEPDARDLRGKTKMESFHAGCEWLLCKNSAKTRDLSCFPWVLYRCFYMVFRWVLFLLPVSAAFQKRLLVLKETDKLEMLQLREIKKAEKWLRRSTPPTISQPFWADVPVPRDPTRNSFWVF